MCRRAFLLQAKQINTCVLTVGLHIWRGYCLLGNTSSLHTTSSFPSTLMGCCCCCLATKWPTHSSGSSVCAELPHLWPSTTHQGWGKAVPTHPVPVPLLAVRSKHSSSLGRLPQSTAAAATVLYYNTSLGFNTTINTRSKVMKCKRMVVAILCEGCFIVIVNNEFIVLLIEGCVHCCGSRN